MTCFYVVNGCVATCIKSGNPGGKVLLAKTCSDCFKADNISNIIFVHR